MDRNGWTTVSVNPGLVPRGKRGVDVVHPESKEPVVRIDLRGVGLMVRNDIL